MTENRIIPEVIEALDSTSIADPSDIRVLTLHTVWAGLSVGQAARPPDTPDRPSRPPDKGQTGIDWPPMVNKRVKRALTHFRGQPPQTAILHVTRSAGNSKKSYYNKVNLEQWFLCLQYLRPVHIRRNGQGRPPARPVRPPKGLRTPGMTTLVAGAP
jgi:hypothetical protein